MPYIVYHNPEAPRERVLLSGVGEFSHGRGRRVDGDLVRAVLGEVTAEGHYERNVRFRPGVDPEIAAIKDTAQRALEAAALAELEQHLELHLDEHIESYASTEFVADETPAAEDETNEEDQAE